MSLRKRGKYTYWYNAAPFTDVFEALDVLRASCSSTEGIYLAQDDEHGWQIEENWYRDADSGGGRGGVHYYEVSPELAAKLKDEEYVTARKEIGWGYTRYNKNKLVITPGARELAAEYWEKLMAKADSMLKPGVHTDLTGRPVRTSARRDNTSGKPYVEYKMPNGDTCRVYPEDGRIFAPYEYGMEKDEVKASA